MAEAIRLLDELPAFRPTKNAFDGVSAVRWRKALRFFRKWEPYIERIRHDFGGHFGLQPAVFAVEHLNDTPVVLEFKRDPLTDRVGPRLKFVTELTAIAMRRHQVVDTSPGHFRRMFVLANLGFNHSVRVVHALTGNYIFGRLGG